MSVDDRTTAAQGKTSEGAAAPAAAVTWWGRRRVLGVLAAGTAVVAAGSVMLTTRRSSARGSWPALDPGERIGAVTVVAVHPPQFGAVPIVLATAEGTRFQVDVLARDPEGPGGIADTAHYSLFLANHGDGSTSTDEAQGLGVMALAERLRALEQGPGPQLLTLRERGETHGGAALGVPLS